MWGIYGTLWKAQRLYYLDTIYHELTIRKRPIGPKYRSTKTAVSNDECHCFYSCGYVAKINIPWPWPCDRVWYKQTQGDLRSGKKFRQESRWLHTWVLIEFSAEWKFYSSPYAWRDSTRTVPQMELTRNLQGIVLYHHLQAAISRSRSRSRSRGIYFSNAS